MKYTDNTLFKPLTIRHNTISNQTHNRNIITIDINDGCINTDTRRIAKQIDPRQNSHIGDKFTFSTY